MGTIIKLIDNLKLLSLVGTDSINKKNSKERVSNEVKFLGVFKHSLA